MKTIIEPFKIKMVEPIRLTTPEERDAALRQAHFNLFQIPAEQVMIDLLTDSGTSAMSHEQWAGMLRGDESYAGARSWYRFERVVSELTGMPHILPTHQGRASENAYLIKQREPGQAGRTARQIAREMFDLADGATISAKKDGLANIGGLLLLRDDELAKRADNLLILTEGFVTYGGLAGRDLEAMAQGFVEVLDEYYLQYRLRSVEDLGEGLIQAGIQIVEPPGGHATYIDAGGLCPH